MRVAVIFLALFTLINCLCNQNCENCEVNNGNNDAEDTEICTKCKKGYTLDKSNACIEANTALPGCEVIDSKNANKCKLCLDGYELKNDGTCNQIYEYKECGGIKYNYCLSCSKTDSSKCGECRPGYQLGDGECFKKLSGSMSLGITQAFIILMNILILV